MLQLSHLLQSEKSEVDTQMKPYWKLNLWAIQLTLATVRLQFTACSVNLAKSNTVYGSRQSKQEKQTESF